MSHKVITFHYTLTDADGVVIESSVERGEPITFMTGIGMIVPGLEREIVNFAEGHKQKVEVKAEEAYGLIDFTKYVQVPKEALPKPDIAVGDVFQSNVSPTPFTVKEVHETHVVLDGNHPLAGEDLTFDVEVKENRDATEEEVAEVREQIAAAQQAQAEGNPPPQPPADEPPAADEAPKA